MNLLVLGTRPPFPVNNGGTRASDRLIQDLISLGHRVSYLAPTTDPLHPALDPLGKKFQGAQVFAWPLNSAKPAAYAAKVLRQTLSSPLVVSKYEASDYAPFVLQQSHSAPPDVIILEAIHLAQLAFSLFPKTPIILRWHNDEPALFRDLHPYLFWEHSRFRRFQDGGQHAAGWLARMAAVWYISFQDYQKSIHPQRVYYPMSLPEIPQCPPPAEVQLGMLADFRYAPNKEALSWWEQKSKQSPQLPSAIIRGLDSPQGPVAKVEDFYQQVSHVLIPTQVGRGIPVKLIEAATYGRPIFCTPTMVQGLPDLPKTGITVAEREELISLFTSTAAAPDSSAYHHQQKCLQAWATHHFLSKNLAANLQASLVTALESPRINK